MTVECHRERAGQAGIPFQKGDIRPNHSVAKPGLQVAELSRSSVRSAGCRHLVSRQLRPGDREVGRQWLADDDPCAAEFPVPDQNRRQVVYRLDPHGEP